MITFKIYFFPSSNNLIPTKRLKVQWKYLLFKTKYVCSLFGSRAKRKLILHHPHKKFKKPIGTFIYVPAIFASRAEPPPDFFDRRRNLGRSRMQMNAAGGRFSLAEDSSPGAKRCFHPRETFDHQLSFAAFYFLASAHTRAFRESCTPTPTQNHPRQFCRFRFCNQRILDYLTIKWYFNTMV